MYINAGCIMNSHLNDHQLRDVNSQLQYKLVYL